MTSTEVAKAAGVSRARVNEWVRRGDLVPDPAATMRSAEGRVTKYLFDPQAVRVFLAAGRDRARARREAAHKARIAGRREEALAILRANGGNYRQAAKVLGVTPKTVSRWAVEGGLPARPRGNPRRPKRAAS